MGVFETVGLLWVLLTSTLATVSILYLAYIGLRVMIRHDALRVESVADPVTVRTIPVIWGRRTNGAHEHAIHVKV